MAVWGSGLVSDQAEQGRNDSLGRDCEGQANPYYSAQHQRDNGII
jgi:hypothetical protein